MIAFSQVNKQLFNAKLNGAASKSSAHLRHDIDFLPKNVLKLLHSEIKRKHIHVVSNTKNRLFSYWENDAYCRTEKRFFYSKTYV